MVFIEEINLKHILKTRQINQKYKKTYLEKWLIKHGYHSTNVNEGVAVVIADVSGYIEKAERQLNK